MNTLDCQARESASLRELYAAIAREHRAMIRGSRFCLAACLAGILVGAACAAMGWTL